MNDCDLRTVAVGRERLPGGHNPPRHRHLGPYAILCLQGRFEQVGYAGRVRVTAGDLLVQPTLDAHANLTPPAGVTILRLPWPDVNDVGGVYPLADPDQIARLAERDPLQATALAQTQHQASRARRELRDLPDLLHRGLVMQQVPDLARWAAAAGVARETASRAFRAAFGVSARTFRWELHAREAWLAVVRTSEGLAAIAARTGFADQAHMTRQIQALTGKSPSAWRADPRTQQFRRAAG